MSSREAFGYSGRYIAKRLLDAGCRVRTLTSRKKPADLFYEKVETFPLAFENRKRLIESLRGATVLYNTYWVRFQP